MTTDADIEGLARALELLADTQADEQVYLGPTNASQTWHLDVVEFDEGYGPRFAVYAEYDGNVRFEERGLPLPEGSLIDADEGSNATVTFGVLDSFGAATLLAQWATILSHGSGFDWSTSMD